MPTVLFVVSAAKELTLKDGSTRPTGVWAEELATPYRKFREAGWDISVASPGGIAPTIDPFSLGLAGGLPATRRKTRRTLAAMEELLAAPQDLRHADPLAADIVFYPGGHAPMEDLATCPDSGEFLVRRLQSGKLLGMLCHAPAAILAARLPHGSNAFVGRRMTALSNKEELLTPQALKLDWFLEDRLKQVGVNYEAGFPLRPHVVVDGSLMTGQNPQSSAALADALLSALGR